MFEKLTGQIIQDNRHVLSQDPFFLGKCSSWDLGAGYFEYHTQDKDIILMEIDQKGNYQCYEI